MSRAIQIRVSESAVRTVHVEDGVAAPLEMLPILAPARMAELLAAELLARGFVRDGATCRRTDPDGIEIVVDLEGATVTARLAADTRLEDSLELKARVDSDHSAMAEAALRDRAAEVLEQRLDEKTAALQQSVTTTLEAKLAELRQEIDRAIGRATVAALTEKAAQLGRIEETIEDDAGNVTIRVRL